MPKDKFEGLPVIDADESEQITVAIRSYDMGVVNLADPVKNPIAVALRRQRGVADARVSRREVLIRRGDQWYRYDAPKLVEE
jgi:hypothetical protein